LHRSEHFMVLVCYPRHFILLGRSHQSVRPLWYCTWVVLLSLDITHFTQEPVIIAYDCHISLLFIFIAFVIPSDCRWDRRLSGIYTGPHAVESIHVLAIRTVTSSFHTSAVMLGKGAIIPIHRINGITAGRKEKFVKLKGFTGHEGSFSMGGSRIGVQEPLWVAR
jgi:uncharacterized protein (UPF0248 family)